MIGPHGHVTPRPDGQRARCGGPGICPVCSVEQAEKLSESKAVAKDDIVLRFTIGSGAEGFFLRVASRHGHESAKALADGLLPYLRDDVTLSAEVETPSRFSP